MASQASPPRKPSRRNARGRERLRRLTKAIEQLGDSWLRASPATELPQAELFYRDLIWLALRRLGRQLLEARGWWPCAGWNSFAAAPQLQALEDVIPEEDVAAADLAIRNAWQSEADDADEARLTVGDLGSLYEELLSFHPLLDAARKSFTLAPVTGKSRKQQGAYYTPPSLIAVVLDTALEPVLDARLKDHSGRAAEAALLAVRICDPACGSGSFLVAAARRLANRLRPFRQTDGRGDADERSTLREVISQCVYGVDLDPLAVQLARFHLWVESGDPNGSWADLNAHIRCGNSLLGAPPQFLTCGIPASAYSPSDSDDTATCNDLRRTNKLARGELEALAGKCRSPDVERLLADAWCAAFLGEKQQRRVALVVTNQTLRTIAEDAAKLAPALRAEIVRLREKYRWWHWQHEFPEIFASQATSPGGFDVVFGNPPFRNAIEGSRNRRVKRLLQAVAPELKGTADLAYRFVALAHRLTAPQGAVGFILPKAFLSAPSAAGLRGKLMRERPPARLWLHREDRLFAGAAAYVCAIALQRSAAQCLVARAVEGTLIRWEPLALASSDWWREVIEVDGVANPARAPELSSSRVLLADEFEVRASLTVAEAYRLPPWLVDSLTGTAPCLVTTRLIDPGECLWGKQTCRYLGQRYAYPRVALAKDAPLELERRARQSLRPKILVAGLCNRLEAYCDAEGQCLGAVSTFSIFHAQDDAAVLAKLCAWLNAPAATAQLFANLGAPSMGDGYFTLKKDKLRQLALPHELRLASQT